MCVAVQSMGGPPKPAAHRYCDAAEHSSETVPEGNGSREFDRAVAVVAASHAAMPFTQPCQPCARERVKVGRRCNPEWSSPRYSAGQ